MFYICVPVCSEYRFIIRLLVSVYLVERYNRINVGLPQIAENICIQIEINN